MSKIDDYLKANGFTLHRYGKHLIYTNGVRHLSVSKTASDFRQEDNVIRDIKRVQRASGLPFVDPFRIEKKEKLPVTTSMPIPREAFNAPRVEVEQKKVKPLDTEAKEIMLSGRSQGKTTPEIAQVLAGLGYTDKEGSPVHFRHVNAALATHASAERRNNPPPPKPVKEKPAKAQRNKLLHDVSEILTSNLSDDMKEKFIIQLCQEHQ